MQENAMRQRVRQAVRRRFKAVDTSTVAELARQAGLRYTTLARYLLYEPPQTRFPQKRTIDKLARCLDYSPEWLRDGIGGKQLGMWPVAIETRLDPKTVDPMDEAIKATKALLLVSPEARLAAARASVAAMVSAVVGSFESVPPQLYESLLQIDALHWKDQATSARIG